MSTNPNTVKSQHELTNEGGRKSEVLLSTIEELERTKKQLEIAKSYLNVIKCLRNGKCLQCVDFAYRALRKIEELNK